MLEQLISEVEVMWISNPLIILCCTSSIYAYFKLNAFSSAFAYEVKRPEKQMVQF